MSVLGLIGVIAAAVLIGLVVVTAAALTWAAVTSVVRAAMKKKNAVKGIVIAKPEMEAIAKTIRGNKDIGNAEEIAKKLMDMLSKEQKGLLNEVHDGYHFGALDAKDKSRDDFKYGGVI
ncbi:MAG: hypothetical protein IJ387_00655, partial [Thermoguttaceae bacterium]|nr:hypothetical protein [Thermoguttaceae bacterium]